MDYDWLVVGAGFTGCTLARLLAEDGARVLLVDKHPYIGGNAHDRVHPEYGVRYNIHGPHIFHTNSKEVFTFLSRFTDWEPYQHQVRAVVENYDPIVLPVNFNSLRTIYGWRSAETVIDEIQRSFPNHPQVTVNQLRHNPSTVEVGQDLWKLLFENYSRRHWGMDPDKLDSMVTGRIPIRLSGDDRHFLDRYQYSPSRGYTEMLELMIKHHNIRTIVNEDGINLRLMARQIIYTGGIDSYFDYELGRLPYRSLIIDYYPMEESSGQIWATTNFPKSLSHLRMSRQRMISQEKTFGSKFEDILIAERPQDYTGLEEQYYPVPSEESRALYQRYVDLANEVSPDVIFAGRLGSYKYIEMGQAVAGAMALRRRLR